jgi:hypothetical protein
MGKDGDEQVLEEFFQAVTPLIEELVTRAVQQGQRIRGLVVLLERKFDGEVVGGGGARGGIDARLRAIAGVDGHARRTILHEVDRAPPADVPVVLLVHGEGFMSVGIRRVTGRTAWLS